MHSGKLHYVSANPGGGAATLSGASSVYCVLGTPPQWRRYSRLLWRQGPALLLEEVLSAQTVSIIYQLGPHYVGTLQAPLPPGQNQEPLTPLVAEEKVVFGINARAMSQLTLAKIRKVYSKNDNKAIAKQLGMSSHENATPIRVLHNSAGHLMGPARCLGGTVVGYLGVRVFCPKPAAIMIDTVGGCSVLLGLIAMAQDVECLYAGVKALVCVVRSNKAAQAEMDRRKGYQTLAMLLKRKKQLLNSHILHLIFGLVGTVDSQKETSSIPNLTAFQDLICELEVWLGAPGGLIKSLLEHLLELATETAHRAHNLRTMRDLQLVSRLLYIISDASARPAATRHVLIQLLAALLAGQPRPNDLLCLGQFMAYTLPLPSQTEKGLTLVESDCEKECEGEHVILRNKCFNVLHGLLFTARNLVNTIVCEEISRVLGLDWLLSFMQENVHPTTVLWALRILVILCSGQGQPSSIMQRFREGAGNGGWLRHTEGSAAPQQAGVVLASAVRSQAHLHSALLHTAGFTLLTWLILYHLEVPELYYLLFGLMLGQPMRAVCSERAVCVDRVWSAAWGAAAPARQSPAALAARITLCAEPAVALLAAARALVHADPAPPDWLAEHPVAIVQVLFSLYNTLPDFVGIMMTAEVLTALASTLFPPHTSDDIHMPICESGDSSGASTPGSEKEVVIPSGGALTTHPVRAGVMDFLKVIVLDSLSLTVTGKSSPVIDLVLDASPPNSTSQQQVEYQTEVLTTVMENLLNTELFGTESNISNVCYLAARLVDKLWQGQLSRDPHEKVTGGLTRLASRTKVKKEESAKQRAHLPREHALAYMQDHVQLVRQAWCVQLQTAANTSAHTTRYVQAEWAGAWRELTRERGLWGPPRASPLDKWALDSTEGPCRMRKMLRRNHHFYLHYPYRPHLQHPDNKQLKYKVAQSLDSKEYYRVYQQWRTAGNSLGETDCIETSDIDMYKEEITNNRDTSLDVTNEEGSPTDLVSSGVVSRGSNNTSGEGNEDGPDVEDEDEQQSPPPDNQTLLRLLEHHEKISHMFRCARIQGLDTTEGLLLFGREHCYVIDGFTLLKNREIRDLDSCPDDYEPILPSQGIQRSNQRQCSKFLYEDIREVHKRRYLLQPIALEVFSSDGRNYLLAFPRKVRNKVYSRFTALATGMADSAAGSVAGQKRGVAVEQPAGLLASLIGDTSVTQRWLVTCNYNIAYILYSISFPYSSVNGLTDSHVKFVSIFSSIDDPLKKNATIGFINNFGQIPKQLFKKAHPSKKMSQRSSTILDPNNIIPSQGITPPEKLFFHNLENLRPSLQPVKEVKGPVGQILYTDKAILAVEQNKVLMPPAYNKYVAWGFADHSLRIGNYDSERAVFVSEAAAHACGELVACVCPSDKTIVTAGTSTVVTVWQYWARRRRLAVKVCLYGHSEAVTCLAASAAYNLVVSGSRDGHAIVWDVERGSFVRQLLPPHLAGPPPPVSALAIDDLTGDIATCSGSWLHAWSINGQLLGAADGGAGQQLLCAAFSQAREWDPLNVIITGSTDGVVRMFSIDYVAETLEEETQSQDVSIEPITNSMESELKERPAVPAQDSECVTATESEVKSDAEDQVDEAAAIKRVEELVKQMSLSQEPEGNLTKSGSESSLSDACETTSAKESARRHDEKDTCSDNDEPYREKQDVYSDDTARHYDNDKDGDSEAHGVEKEGDTGTHEGNDEDSGIERIDKEEDIGSHEDDRDVDVENVTHRSKLQKQGHVVLRRKSKANPLYRKSGGSIGESSESGSQEAGGSAGGGRDSCEGAGEGLRTSKSDTSLSDSFVMLSAPPSPSPKPARSSHAATSAEVSGEGAGAVRWRRRLVLRGKLTMHTAYERRDNASPAAVTAVAAARSGRGLAVGDARGRIFRWSAPDMSSAAGAKGGPADHWIRDDTAPFCTQCQVRFTALERRHHCRECGAVFCGRCTRYEAPVRRLRALRPVRVCQRCHDNIHGKKE
ncbi:WD repeat and FYVE domain-containing protein 3 [Papilio machaon]|uniref:WD repeat and FYVE domain-containing protein 3 n=1 Tax=Papilio machaon TaxID=76193 RepID=A0A194R0Y0_PAPMA|nr:WD repeat and FYVE domain-containing protein 3 [Papilio machaon]